MKRQNNQSKMYCEKEVSEIVVPEKVNEIYEPTVDVK